MLMLPAQTEVNSRIPQKTIFLRTIRKPNYRTLYTEQVQELWWRNKLSRETFGIERIGAFPEIEIFETKLCNKTLDKRLLREIDRAIPYYILHVLTYEDKHQILMADKTMRGSNIRVNNYLRSCWLDDNMLSLDFQEKSIGKLYESLGQQIRAGSHKAVNTIATAESDAFLRYFQTMAMARSYKPILIIAALQSGGQLSIREAAAFFRRYYAERIQNGLPVEKGNCVYADPAATDKEIESNLIRNPVAALCKSGFFTYDQTTRMFSLRQEIYDGLTVDDVDTVLQICQMRLTDYFHRSSSSR